MSFFSLFSCIYHTIACIFSNLSLVFNRNEPNQFVSSCSKNNFTVTVVTEMSLLQSYIVWYLIISFWRLNVIHTYTVIRRFVVGVLYFFLFIPKHLDFSIINISEINQIWIHVTWNLSVKMRALVLYRILHWTVRFIWYRVRLVHSVLVCRSMVSNFWKSSTKNWYLCFSLNN